MKTNLRTSDKELEILGLIQARGAVSRAELVKVMGLSAGLISAVVRRLIARDLVVESGLEPSKLGRRRVALKLCPGTAYTVGVEIGTFFLRIAVNDIAGNVCHKLETRTMLSASGSHIRASSTAIRVSSYHFPGRDRWRSGGASLYAKWLKKDSRCRVLWKTAFAWRLCSKSRLG